MKAFKDGAEIRITKEDLQQIIQYAIKERIFSMAMRNHTVSDITLHPANKYAVRFRVTDQEAREQS